MTAFPESPAQTGEDAARHEGQSNEAKDVVSVSHVASANCSRGEEVAEEARTKEYEAKPRPNANTRVGSGDWTWRCHGASEGFYQWSRNTGAIAVSSTDLRDY